MLQLLCTPAGIMNGVGDVQADFASGVEDVFLAGFDAWGELGQVRGCILGGIATEWLGTHPMRGTGA